MRKRINVIGIVSLIVLMLLPSVLFTTPAHADDNDDLAGATGFTYRVHFPDNQMEDNIGYYKLKMSKGQEQTVNVTLTNPSAEKLTVNVGLNGAVTNQNGVIEYGDSDIENDASLKFDFADIVTGPESVDLEAGETKTLELKIQMPETGIEGVIAGGIQLMKANQEDNISNEGGSRIINQYAYVIAMLLQESAGTLTPDLKLNQVFAGQSNYRNAIFIDFSNIIPAFLNDMTVETQINAKGNEAVLYERKQTAMRMAPNSFIQFPISMNGERMISGTYIANILVTSGDQKWAWKEEFEITQEDADKFNERDVGLVQEKGFNWQLIVMIVGAVLALGGVVYGLIVFLRKKQQKKEQAEKQARKKKKANGTKSKKRPLDE
ncbi:DUF916 and DUF3324 domain-containing protein [Enterococcus termitis]|uniref:Uncharacterized protein n=1 Tax=Enterococcus termitis TaxID=332950 RepID=A0A1E5H187_9ENTE|nr:DUF916 and DUF3324 domain-containing protein [Enterococcus termitis]OEG18400.1 hypothetical protein BCR25_16360 [Enterococcus termitis]OJG96961.1 hypothetical protein RV18_GL001310 [Enterococcus termitis]